MSERVILPPCEGIWRMPWSACSVRPERPCEARLLQACLSPIFGEPFAPEAWHLAQTASTTSLPESSAACAYTACGETAAMRASRAAKREIMARTYASLPRADLIQIKNRVTGSSGFPGLELVDPAVGHQREEQVSVANDVRADVVDVLHHAIVERPRRT